jgi:NhaP-type Na+/H+ and K+/H+ antiporter
LILIALANDAASSAGGWAILVGEVLILGPVIGFGISAVGAYLMSWADKKYGVSEVYQSLYGVGITLLAYATATALGGDGFLAAFAAGFAVAILNFDLCQCFLDYGETTSEMAMLLSFILFGVVISDLFGEVPLIPALILAAIVIFIARPLAIWLVLRKAAISNRARAFIGWFGPRGLNSLLLALLVVQAGVANSELILAIVGVVVTVSVVAHGASATPLSSAYGRAVENETHEEERDDVGGIFKGDASGSIRIKPERLAEMLESEDPPLVLDVRTRSQYEADRSSIPGSERVSPDGIEDWVQEREEAYGSQTHGQRIVAYCT